MYDHLMRIINILETIRTWVMNCHYDQHLTKSFRDELMKSLSMSEKLHLSDGTVYIMKIYLHILHILNDEQCNCLDEVINMPCPTERTRGDALMLLALAYLTKHHFDKALKSAEEALHLFLQHPKKYKTEIKFIQEFRNHLYTQRLK